MKVFITGASSGIGAALAKVFAAQGAQCMLVSRRLDALESVRLALPHPERHRCRVVDVTDAVALRDAARHCVDEWGLPDIVIASAGISGGTATADPDDLVAFERIVDTNLIATVATFGAFLGAFLDAGRSANDGVVRTLVVIASVAGIRGLPGAGAYSASKAAVLTYAESLRIELRGTTVRVVIIAPGFIDTPMTVGNPYPMPFLMPVDAFARRAAKAIVAGRAYVVIPWQMAWVARLLKILPNALFDAALAGRGRKPRLKHD